MQRAYSYKEGRTGEIETHSSWRSDHDIVVFEPDFLLGTRWDARRQLIRPKKPTIAFIVVPPCIYLHTTICMHVSVRAYIQTNNRECMQPHRRVKNLMPLQGASGFLLPVKKTSTRVKALYLKTIYGKRRW